MSDGFTVPNATVVPCDVHKPTCGIRIPEDQKCVFVNCVAHDNGDPGYGIRYHKSHLLDWLVAGFLLALVALTVYKAFNPPIP